MPSAVAAVPRYELTIRIACKDRGVDCAAGEELDVISSGSSVGAGEAEDLRPVRVSTINFVDLAGSERSSQSAKDDTADRSRQAEVQMGLSS